MDTQKEQTCQERVKVNFESRIDDLRKLWAADCEGNESGVDELGTLNEYGLCFDYVAPGTFDDQPEGYFRYQLSWGGPSDEFRIYAESIKEYQWSVYRVDYWFLDWFDGAGYHLSGDDLKFLEEFFTGYFVESGCADHVHAEALGLLWPGRLQRGHA
jgi:hypothetical protein